MRVSVGQIATVDGIAYLPGWPKSRGATFEIFLAAQIGVVVMPVADWLLASSGLDDSVIADESQSREPAPAVDSHESFGVVL